MGSDALRAMALFRLGRTDEARVAWRDSAPRSVLPNARAVYSAYEWLVAHLLCSEAETLLAVPVSPSSRGSRHLRTRAAVQSATGTATVPSWGMWRCGTVLPQQSQIESA
jgi:hypothetical protein